MLWDYGGKIKQEGWTLETRKSNGELYPPATLHQLLCGIVRYMRNKNPACPNFLDKKDSRFRDLHGTLDFYFHNWDWKTDKTCRDDIMQ